MTWPLDLADLTRMTLEAGRAYLSRAGEIGEAGAAEAAGVLEAWGKRLKELAVKAARGEIKGDDVRRAVQSENEALALNLAAIVNEHRRAFLADLLSTSLNFIGKLLKGRP